MYLHFLRFPQMDTGLLPPDQLKGYQIRQSEPDPQRYVFGLKFLQILWDEAFLLIHPASPENRSDLQQI